MAGTVHAARATPQQPVDKRSRLSAWTTGAGVLQLEVVQRAANVSWVRHKHCTGRQQQHSLLPCRAGAQPTGTNTSRDRAFGPSEWEQTIIQTRKQRELSTVFPHEPALLQRITSRSCSTALGRATCGQEGLQRKETGGREKNAIPQQNTTQTRCLYQPPLDRAVVSFHFADEESAARGSYKSSVTLGILPPHLHS